MSDFDREKEWAARLIAASLENVFVHPVTGEDRSRTHDLDIERCGGVFAAVVVAAVADSECLALWDMVNDRDQHWVEPGLTGGWTVALLPYARAAAIRTRVPRLLERLGRAGLRSLRGDDSGPAEEVSEARRLGVAAVTRHVSRVPGTISLTIQQPDEMDAELDDEQAHSSGDVLRAWITDWIRNSDQADQVSRLERSGAPERHLFAVVPGFTTAPLTVVQALLRDDPLLPVDPPDLPPEVTHLWLASTWATGAGIRWSPDAGWGTFVKF